MGLTLHLDAFKVGVVLTQLVFQFIGSLLGFLRGLLLGGQFDTQLIAHLVEAGQFRLLPFVLVRLREFDFCPFQLSFILPQQPFKLFDALLRFGRLLAFRSELALKVVAFVMLRQPNVGFSISSKWCVLR